MPLKILLVDDDEQLAAELNEIFRLNAFDVDICNAGSTGLQHALANQYDVVLLDIKLPDISGIHVLDILKNERPGLKIFIMSGRPMFNSLAKLDPENEKEEKILKKADKIISKPFKVKELLRALGVMI